MARLEWARDSDWDGWLAGMKRLEDDHPTVGREYNPVRQVAGRIRDRSDANHGETLGPLALEALDRLVVEIRARDYSYRTEGTFCCFGLEMVLFRRRRRRPSTIWRIWPLDAMFRPARRVWRSMRWLSFLPKF